MYDKISQTEQQHKVRQKCYQKWQEGQNLTNDSYRRNIYGLYWNCVWNNHAPLLRLRVKMTREMAVEQTAPQCSVIKSKLSTHHRIRYLKSSEVGELPLKKYAEATVNQYQAEPCRPRKLTIALHNHQPCNDSRIINNWKKIGHQSQDLKI